MPEQPAGFDPREAERLDQAIDSIMAGAVPPASGDARLDLLVALAARLHRELPRDLPDPAFRARLKEDLTSRLPLVPPVSRRPSPFRRHLPVYGSLAAVFVVALVAGALAFWPEEDQPTTATTGARLEQAPFAATTAFTPPTETFASDIVTRTAEAATSMTTALLAPTATLVPAAATEPAASESPSPTATTAQQPTQPAAPGSATVFQASLPEIDPATVEEGPVPAADGGGSGPSTDVTYVMAATAPDLGTSATVYRLSPPAEDPVTFCRELAAKAGIPSDDVRSTAESGRTEVFAGEPGAGTVYWRPDAGVFQLSGDAVAGEGDLEPDAVGSRALDWLASIGYPVGTLGEPRVDDLGELWLVEFPYAGVAGPGVGHPLRPSLKLQRDARSPRRTATGSRWIAKSRCPSSASPTPGRLSLTAAATGATAGCRPRAASSASRPCASAPS